MAFYVFQLCHVMYYFLTESYDKIYIITYLLKKKWTGQIAWFIGLMHGFSMFR